jgi:signal transduction histidine kinase
MRHRLQFQIFGAIAMSGLICVALAGLIALVFYEELHPLPRVAGEIGELIVEGLPPANTPEFQRAFRQRARKLHASVSLWDAQGKLIARSGRALERPPRARKRGGFASSRDHSLVVHFEDGRMLKVDSGLRMPPEAVRKFAGSLVFLVCVLLMGSHWAARHIGRRLDRLEATVARFGSGDLSARADIKGQDEIARLAQAFNRNFERIAGLLRQQRRMLQSASHELRSPLTRLRMAFELATDAEVDTATRERLRGEAGRDIDELDALIGDLLLAGRLSDTELPRDFTRVSFKDIVSEEAKKVSAEVQADEVTLDGNARMLRSMVRNLLENARRYGKDPIVATLRTEPTRVLLRVEDAGEGVPPEERERIFEPFYRPPGHREGQHGGVGLGLALVRTIAAHHGGSVRYVEREGKGSVFEVELPLTV